MISLEEFRFLRPEWLLALPALAVLLWWLYRHPLRAGDWRRVCDPRLLEHLLDRGHAGQRSWPLWLAALAALLAIVALAGPTWERLPQPVYRDQSALVVALDLSRSMDATDVKPSRLARARFKLADLLKSRREGQTGLLVYAAEAFTVSPITDDAGTLLNQLPALETRLMPAQGSRPGVALELAVKLLRRGGAHQGDILLITDGLSPGDAQAAAKALAGSRHRLSVWGIGTPEGAPIPAADGGFVTDADGQIVIPRLAEAELRRLAAGSGGAYWRMRHDDSDLQALGDFLAGAAGNEQGAETDLHTEQWREMGPWLLLPLLPLAALGFRRGYLFGLALLLVPPPGQALEWDELWWRPDQQGQQSLQAGDAGRAAEQFQDPAWRAAAHYRAGDFDAAARGLAGREDPDSQYNRGNALARQGRLEEAIAAYQASLKAQPDHADARHNLELLEKLRQQQEHEQEQEQEGQSGENDDEQDAQQQEGGQQGDEGQQAGETQDGDEASQGSPNQASPTGQDPAKPASEAEEGEEPGHDAAQGDEQSQTPSSSGQEEDTTTATDMQQRDESEPPPQDSRSALNESSGNSEQQQATEQWLRRIPDDPGGLLRRKFLYQYQRREGARDQETQTW